MRALRVLGLADSGDCLVCEDEATGERFAVPTDQSTPAAAGRPADPPEEQGRASFAQLRVDAPADPPSSLRPAEIQARIRAGASEEDVARAAGTTVARIERFVYPVLLERSSMADRARRGVPLIDGIAGKRSVDELVRITLAGRGHDSDIQWDAYRNDTGWVLVLRWTAGRSDNRAEWAIHPRPGIGTLTPRDDAAVEIVDPAPRPLRTIGDGGGRSSGRPARSGPADDALFAPDPAGVVAVDDGLLPRGDEPQPPARTTAAAQASSPPRAQDDQDANRAADSSPSTSTATPSTPTPSTPTTSAAPVDPASAASTAVDARTGTDHPRPRSRRTGRPAMPSWDDALLGGGSATKR